MDGTNDKSIEPMSEEREAYLRVECHNKLCVESDRDIWMEIERLRSECKNLSDRVRLAEKLLYVLNGITTQCEQNCFVVKYNEN